MNKHLKYAKNATKVGFTDAVNNFMPNNNSLVTNKKEHIYNTANNCRWWYTPIWSDETQYLPNENRNQVEVEETVSNTDVSNLTVPPERKKNLLLTAALIGAGTFIALKILT